MWRHYCLTDRFPMIKGFKIWKIFTYWWFQNQRFQLLCVCFKCLHLWLTCILVYFSPLLEYSPFDITATPYCKFTSYCSTIKAPRFSRSVDSHLNLDILQQYRPGEVRWRWRGGEGRRRGQEGCGGHASTLHRPADLLSNWSECILWFTAKNELHFFVQLTMYLL